ncbi:hypothetical protein BDD12DRAFT_877402 [Trichophaea hybrida]|nr:hypothetical protein BDD12DRAFT_877402 [Trichophaea hybrida]
MQRGTIIVFFMDRNENLQEYWNFFDGALNNWQIGGFCASPKTPHALYTCLAAIGYGNYLRVYYQTPNGTIQEHCWDPTKRWYQGSSLPVALSGTSLAATANDLTVFYQDTTGWLRERGWSAEGWKDGSVMIEVSRNTSIAAVSWPDKSQDRVYYRSLSEEIVEVKSRAYPVRMTVCNGGSSIAATTSDDSVVVFHQRSPRQLHQVRNLGESREWLLGHVVPTGSLV